MRAAPPDLESLSAQEVLAHVVDEHHPRLYVACSFQKEASVILDMLLAIEPRARVFTLDTGVLFPETYETWRRIEQRYGIEIDVYRGEWIDGLWQRDPDACCGMRKVEPLERALSEVDAWITGLRREQSPNRADTPKLGPDPGHPGKLKCAPLADWTEKDVWRYIGERDVPYHPLHDRGYASIGCTHCTAPGGGREGRWAGTDKIECGLHLPGT
ncbi:MAG TPA: phosphoadenylyl-sulfate reductase [Solirubrobacteraceae bacterium]|nr:phosphoadenylyl-sulfate reductase [Solirubrobacteraceae bacterium]